MSDTATVSNLSTNGSSASVKGKGKATKRPNDRFVGASSSDLGETKVSLGIETTPTDWTKLPINSTFSKSKSGLPLCVKVSTSSFVEVFSNRRENRIGGGEVYRVIQK